MTTELFKELSPEELKPKVEAPDKSFESLVGDGKKFATQEDLAKGKLESDQFITRLEQEKVELKAELDKRLNLEEFMTKMNEEKPAPVINPQEPIVDETKGEVKFSAEDVEAILEKKFQERDNTSAVDRNLQESNAAMQKAWGDDAIVQLNTKANEIGVSVAQLEELAKTNPNLFKSSLGLSTAPQQVNPTVPNNPQVSTVDTTKLPSTNGEVRNYDYYQKMRKEDPTGYYSPSVQNQMFKHAQEQGDSFHK